jgi:drug/metabolite transporter (DMT)-like permease
MVWGTSYGVAKNAVLYYPVLGFIALRFCITSIMFLPSGINLTISEIKSNLKVGVPLGVILLLIFISETYGLSKTTASNSAFLISLYVVFTPFVQWIILREPPTRRIVIATLLSIVLGIGDYLIIFAAAMRGVMVTLTKKLIQNTSTNTVFLTSIQTGVVGVGCLCLGLIIHFNQLIILPSSILFWGDVIYLVIFCTMFAFFVQNFSVKRTSPTKVSLLMGSEPVWGALYAVIVMHESLTMIGWFGGLIIVTASLWATVQSKSS